MATSLTTRAVYAQLRPVLLEISKTLAAGFCSHHNLMATFTTSLFFSHAFAFTDSKYLKLYLGPLNSVSRGTVC